jgi:Uma2 family endonuclease
MATQTHTAIPTPAASGTSPLGKSGLVPYRLTVRQFEKMIKAGVFRADDRVELLGGLLIKKMTTYDPHDFAVDQLGDNLGRILPGDWIARQEKSVVLGRFWRPQPDLSVARGPRDRYRTTAPTASDLAALIEVSDSTYATDRGAKWTKCAAYGVPEYWIVNVFQRRIEVYSSPTGKGKSAQYRDRKDYGPDEEVPVIVDGREVGRIKVSDIV